MQLASAFAGFRLSLSLILAIGAQNAFVLRQGLRREHVGAVVAFCALSDALLIALGVSGFALAADRLPWLPGLLRWGGVVFLTLYGLRSLRAALRGGAALRPDDHAPKPLLATLATVAAFTWLNPHVYLDTVVLLGSIAAQYPDRLAFALGGMLASAVFFTALGYGARLLAPVFARPRSWQVLDAVIGVTMLTLAAGLALRG